jgi:NADPH-dependent 2,4-dienoyl-CoA reductase/sulfur reductase-like enzyme
MGSAFASIHGEYGVDLKCNVNVVGFEGSESVERVKLADGSTINADLVVIGVGAIPSTQWLENSGLNIDNGVICDEYCAASESGIYAAGDVARWWHPKYQKYLRVEHWSNAVEQGVVSAGNMLKEKKDQISFSPVPYFWSQQYGKKMQFAGHISESDQVEIQHGSVKQQEFLAIYHDNEKFSGVLAFGFQRLFLSYRKLLAEEGSWSDALELARSIV